MIYIYITYIIKCTYVYIYNIHIYINTSRGYHSPTMIGIPTCVASDLKMMTWHLSQGSGWVVKMCGTKFNG